MSTEKRVTEFTIDRATWRRGGGRSNPGLLLDMEGRKCCLGFYAMACGADEEDIRNKGVIGGVTWKNVVQYEIARVNDNDELSDVVREKLVTEYFAAQGITVRFTG